MSIALLYLEALRRERRRAVQRRSTAKYMKTEKGKITQKRYRMSEKGRLAQRLSDMRCRQQRRAYQRRYERTEAGRRARRKYNSSEKGKSRWKRYEKSHPRGMANFVAFWEEMSR